MSATIKDDLWVYHQPLELPADIRGIEDIAARAPGIANAFLIRCLREGYLPPTIRLVLYAAISPKAHGLDIRSPALVNCGQGTDHLRMIKRFGYVTLSARNRGESFYQKVANHYSGKSSAALTFSSKKPAQRKLSEDQNLFLVEVGISTATASDEGRMLDEIAEPTLDGDGEWKSVDILEQESNWTAVLKKTASAKRAKRDVSITCSGLPKGKVQDAEEALQIDIVAASVGNDKEYLNDVAALLPLGNILLVMPRPLWAVKREILGEQLGNSGLTVVIDPEAPIDDFVIRRCYNVADRLSSLLNTAVFVAKQSRLAGENAGMRETARQMMHEIVNDLGRIKTSLGINKLHEAHSLLKSIRQRGVSTGQTLADLDYSISGALVDPARVSSLAQAAAFKARAFYVSVGGRREGGAKPVWSSLSKILSDVWGLWLVYDPDELKLHEPQGANWNASFLGYPGDIEFALSAAMRNAAFHKKHQSIVWVYAEITTANSLKITWHNETDMDGALELQKQLADETGSANTGLGYAQRIAATAQWQGPEYELFQTTSASPRIRTTLQIPGNVGTRGFEYRHPACEKK
ncbi:hypothetical protein Verru16b_03234 [Lacunisphaera limnophila]|uniref:Uncharacterized protein n=1 Tax=Lacunisphaera limnophila TaxID=1838286 RepID=A0A1D8AZ15_9BACT|nr:hypothetical protein [Lacunisphaera limnophila]AOS46138.1 hypothetical protein Verru16b_03234 [Lacunisphaera limnophila]